MVTPSLLRDLALAIAMAAVLSAVLAPAATGESSQKAAKQACVADVQRLCGDVPRGGGRIRKCMTEKHDQLSADCKDAMQRARALSFKLPDK